MPASGQRRRKDFTGVGLYGLPLAVFALLFGAIMAVQQRSVIEAARTEWMELLAAATVITLVWIPVVWFINRRRRLSAKKPDQVVNGAALPAPPAADPPPAREKEAVKPLAVSAKQAAYSPQIEEKELRRLTVDYVPMLERALSQLKTDDHSARENVYDHAREVLVRKLRDMRPILTPAEMLQEKLALEEAIGRVEKFMEDKDSG